MNAFPEMQVTELEIRRLLQLTPAQAMNGIVELYRDSPPSEKEALVIVLAARVAAADAQRGQLMTGLPAEAP